MNTVKGLNDFCRKHKVPVPVGDKFSLLDFLLEVSKRSMLLAEYRGRVTEVIQRLGNESEQWGGCPNCGTNVHLGLKECPVCGKNLELQDSEIEASDLSDLDPEYSSSKKQAVTDLDDFDDDESEVDTESDDLLSEETDESTDDDENEDVDEIEEDDADEDAEESEDHELEDEVSEEDDSSEEEDTDFEEDSDEDDFDEGQDEDEEPLSGPKKTALKGNHYLSKKPVNRPLTAHAEKYAEREVRRRKLESLIPKFKKDPRLILRLKYRDLLIMPGLLGYKRKPTAIGSKQDIQRWIKNALKGGLKK